MSRQISGYLGNLAQFLYPTLIVRLGSRWHIYIDRYIYQSLEKAVIVVGIKKGRGGGG